MILMLFHLFFACLMIIGELTTGVRILLEKGPSRYNISAQPSKTLDIDRRKTRPDLLGPAEMPV